MTPCRGRTSSFATFNRSANSSNRDGLFVCEEYIHVDVQEGDRLLGGRDHRRTVTGGDAGRRGRYGAGAHPAKQGGHHGLSRKRGAVRLSRRAPAAERILD